MYTPRSPWNLGKLMLCEGRGHFVFKKFLPPVSVLMLYESVLRIYYSSTNYTNAFIKIALELVISTHSIVYSEYLKFDYIH